jgi:ABC-type multidrug transport system fused ATPase/permease subunit
MRNSYFSLLKTAWKYARHEKRRFIFIYSLFVISNIIVALNPLFYGWFINEAQKKGTDILRTGWFYVLGFLALRLCEWAFHGPARVMERKLAFTVSQNFLEEIYHKVLHMPVRWHQEHHSGLTISKLRKAYEALKDFFQQGFVYLYSFGKFFFSFVAMLYFSPLFGSIGILLGALTIWIIIKFDKPYVKSMKEVNEREHVVSSTLFDSLSNIITVITLRLEKRIEAGFFSKVKDVFPPFKKNAVINEWKWFTAQMMVGLIYAVVTIGYIYQNYETGNAFFIGGLVVLLGYVNQFTSVFNDIASHYTQITKFDTDIQNAKEIEADYDRAQSHLVKHDFPSNWESIDIDKLNFVRGKSGMTGKKTGLQDVSIKIKKGQRIALIGESGSGKSTLLTLLRGLHEPSSGTQVTVNNKYNARFEDISSAVTLFPQEPEIFENSVLYNITLGLPFSEKEVMAVCEAAQFANVIRQLPHGLRTHMHEKGVNLSGGQKQRLALARGILAARNSDIILLDEPTSSIDPRTEKIIYNNLFEGFENKVIISSLHRMHLLTQFDYIYILKDGAVIEEGTFEQLKRYSLVFQDMWETQATSASDTDSYPKMDVAL